MGRLVPRRPRGLRAGAVTLRPGGVMDWHSTQRREELLVVLDGRLALEVHASKHQVQRLPLRRGQCAFLCSRTVHRVVNRSNTPARYVYVTAQR